MGALRIEIVTLGTNLGVPGFDLFLDCWKASLYVSLDSTTDVYLNGMDAGDMFGNGSNQSSIKAPVVFGGLVMDGKPVNMNATLRFTGRNASITTLIGFLVKEYYDPSLPDPLK